MTVNLDPLAWGFRILDDGTVEPLTEREATTLIRYIFAEAAKILRPPTRGALGGKVGR